ncbi:MAG: Thiamin ABC transporter, substrate-binding component [uncultured Acidimicrobiales bacterium]|uniref:Thiamin ABC transporter, substrate-binding component n=1 Tax=uncultured Acidimicrobiales bacterium TaxID=310071 RepID=A0A6J4IAE0_9ACTN|nr:MAG: Thiamin ABC transporter, substrate-binding component [uncultured Acidimicrobiales bacterium]
MSPRRRRPPLAVLLALSLLAGACGGDDEQGAPPGPAEGSDPAVTLRLVTHDSFAASEEVLAGFTEASGIEVELIANGDAGLVVNQAILTKEDPLGDVLFGVDNTLLTRALDEGIFVPYESPLLEDVDEAYLLDPQHRVTPVDHGEVCLNYDRAHFDEAELAPPDDLDDLVDPAYRGLTVVEDPSTSSPGLAFLLATVDRYGEDGWRDWWSRLRDNDVLVSPGWEDAYYGSFSGGSGEGDRPIVVSYASSPPVEVLNADPRPAVAPTGVVEASCFRQVEAAGILAGTEHEEEARELVDFLLSLPFQEDVPLQMFVFPVNREAQLPALFVEHAVVPDDPLSLPVEEIGANRERWVEEWLDTVVR